MSYGGPYIPNVSDIAHVVPAAAPVDPNAGQPTSFWGRIAQQGAQKVANLVEGTVNAVLVQPVKDMGNFIASSGNAIANEVNGTNANRVKQIKQNTDQANALTNAANTNMVYSSATKAKMLRTAAGDRQMANTMATNTKANNQSLAAGADPLKAMAAGGMLALNFVSGGEATISFKVLMDAGNALLRGVGEFGVKELAAKAGIDVATSTTEQAAAKLAATKVGQIAAKEIVKGSGISSILKAVAVNSGKGSLIGGAFGGLGVVENEGVKTNAKDLATGVVQNAAVGAALSGTVTLLAKGASKVVGRYTGKNDIIAQTKDLQAKNVTAKANADAVLKATVAKKAAANTMAETRGLPQGKVKGPKQLTTGSTAMKQLTGPKNDATKGDGFTIPTKVETAAAQTRAARVSQIDKLVSAAQKNGTTKSAADMRSLMKERTALTSGKDVTTTASEKLTRTTNAPVTVDSIKKINGEASVTDLSTKASNSLENNKLGTKSGAVERAKQQIDNGVAKPIRVRTTPEGKLIIEDGRHRLQAAKELGMKSYPIEDVSSKYKPTSDLHNVVESTPKITSAAEKIKGMSHAQQSGSVDLSAISKDAAAAKAKIEAHIEQTRVTSKFSGNVAHDTKVQEGAATLRAQDAGKLLKQIKVSNIDKKAVYNYREAKAAGTELPKLTHDQQALHDSITKIVEETNANKQELIKLKAPGYTKDKVFNPESGNHREVIGHGSSLERFLRGHAATPTSARSLRISTNSMKARKFFSVTDSAGNREVVTILNRSHREGLKTVSDGKFATILHPDTTNPTELGKLSASDLKKGSFKAANGQTYKIGQATANEVEAVSKTRYIKDPLVSAILDHQATANALDSARMLQKWKGSPEFSKIGMKFGAGTPPKNWRSTTLPQFQGYSFEPKVAEVLNDLHGSIADKSQLAMTVNHFFRNMMVAIPLRHNLNEIGFHFVDRGVTGLLHPIRGSTAIVRGVSDVINTSQFYRDVAKTGFNLMTSTDHGLNKGIMDHTKSMLFEDQTAAQKIASDIGTNVASLREAYNAVQHTSVWIQQDALNLARIHERMAKGMTLEKAAAETARFNPQYQVPSRVAGSRTAANILKNNNLLFFGSYHYDQWKVLANSAMDLAGKNGGKAAFAAADKFAAMTLGIFLTGALVDKGLQNITGNPNASTKPFGVLDLPSQVYDTLTGKQDPGKLITGQIFPSISLNVIAQLFENRDFFTGSQIRDTNASAADQTKQIGTWLYGQSPMSSYQTQVTKGNTAAGVGGVVLSLAGVKLPKNSVETNNLYSLKYDSLPSIQQQAYKQAQGGDIPGAKTTISKYDALVLAAAKSALKSANKPVPGDNVLIKELLTQGYYYRPKDATVQKWSTEHSTSIVNKL